MEFPLSVFVLTSRLPTNLGRTPSPRPTCHILTFVIIFLNFADGRRWTMVRTVWWGNTTEEGTGALDPFEQHEALSLFFYAARRDQ